MPLDPAIEEAIRSRFSRSAFATWMGMELVSVDEGQSEIALDIAVHHLNPGGIAHGGIIATLLDAAIGLALRTTIGARSHVTVQLTVHYLSPATAGRVLATGKQVRTGKRTEFGESEVRAADGRLIAKGAATFLVVEPAPAPAGE